MNKTKPVNVGQEIEIEIESLAPGGKGLGKVEGFPIFLERVCPGDRVLAKIFDVRKSFALASLEKLIKRSKHRQEPVCEVFDRCGGCQWQHIEYSAQLSFKRDILCQSIERIGNLDSSIANDTIGAEHQIQYRNKVQFPVQGQKGNIKAGYYERNSHTLVDIESCPVAPRELDQILSTTKKALNDENLSSYQEATHTGLVRHIVARQSIAKKDILLTLVINRKSENDIEPAILEKLKNVAKQVLSENPELVGVCLNLNGQKGNRILSDKTIKLTGEEFVHEILKSEKDSHSLEFKLSANSFFQVHSHQAVKLLESISEQIKAISGGKKLSIIDAYAGVGTISLWVANLADTVYAVESNKFAVKDGKVNAELNGIENVQFLEGLSEEILPKMNKDGIKADILILDPPRKGLSKTVLNTVLNWGPKHIIYVSCNPSTLARDLKELESNDNKSDEGKSSHIGYKTKRITPIDMFPQTYHVESIACLLKDIEDGSVRNLEKS